MGKLEDAIDQRNQTRFALQRAKAEQKEVTDMMATLADKNRKVLSLRAQLVERTNNLAQLLQSDTSGVIGDAVEVVLVEGKD